MIRSVHIDIEGGWGGSSRSLFELVSRLDRNAVSPLVVHRQMGPIVEEYRNIGVPTVHVPEIGSYVPRRKRGGVMLVQKIPELLKLPGAARKIAKIFEDHDGDVLHLNYEGLFLLGQLLKHHVNVPQVVHVRASSVSLGDDMWTRWMVNSLAKTVDYGFFVSPNEQDLFNRSLRSGAFAGEVMYNIARPTQSHKPLGQPLEAVFLGNLDPIKGVERLVDVAQYLDELNAPPLKIAVYGVARNKSEYADMLAAEISRRDLSHRIELRGFVTNVADVLASALALLRPSIQGDPWGRDVLESVAAGTPCLATGTFQGVVENGVTGFLFDPFDAKEFANKLKLLAEDGTLWRELSSNCILRGQERFSGDTQVTQFMNVLTRLVGDSNIHGAV